MAVVTFQGFKACLLSPNYGNVVAIDPNLRRRLRDHNVPAGNKLSDSMHTGGIIESIDGEGMGQK